MLVQENRIGTFKNLALSSLTRKTFGLEIILGRGLLGKTFRLFGNQKVPYLGVIGFRYFFPEN